MTYDAVTTREYISTLGLTCVPLFPVAVGEQEAWESTKDLHGALCLDVVAGVERERRHAVSEERSLGDSGVG